LRCRFAVILAAGLCAPPAVSADSENPLAWAYPAASEPVNSPSCEACHRQSVDLAGLPADYIVAQVRAMAKGERQDATAAHKVSEADLRAAAEHFAGLPYGPGIRVVETKRAPKSSTGGFEPIRGRIIEIPDDHGPGVVAYAPVGTIASGRRLAEGRDNRIPPCGACHGTDLRGAAAPPLAGRSPTYLARQLWDIKQEARKGEALVSMQVVTARMSPGDIVSLTAYVASLGP